MSQTKANKPKKSLLDVMSPEAVRKARRSADAREASKPPLTSIEWSMLGELGVYYGFQAIQAVLDDYITLHQANKLVMAGRQLYNQQKYDDGVVGLAVRSPNFNKLMEPFINKKAAN